jgi:hypothetical protein
MKYPLGWARRIRSKANDEAMEVYIPFSIDEKTVTRTAANQMINSRGETRQ